MDEKMTCAEDAVRELTLALMFLTRFREKRKVGKEDPWSAWKGYDFDVIDELMKKDFIRGFARGKSVILSKNGMEEARRIIAKYGIEDWESLKGEADWPERLESL
jgi:hypothetical protein